MFEICKMCTAHCNQCYYIHESVKTIYIFPRYLIVNDKFVILHGCNNPETDNKQSVLSNTIQIFTFHRHTVLLSSDISLDCHIKRRYCISDTQVLYARARGGHSLGTTLGLSSRPFILKMVAHLSNVLFTAFFQQTPLCTGKNIPKTTAI